MELTPPSDAEREAAKPILNKPNEVEVVKDDQAVAMVPKPSASESLDLSNKAKGFVKDIANFSINSPEYAAKRQQIETLAQAEISEAGSGSSRMLERAASSVAGAKRSGSDATQRVANTLADLRSTVEDLTPNAAALTGVHKVLGFIPGGKKITRYFQRYESAQGQLDNIIKALLAGQDELRLDNASLVDEKDKQWAQMGVLNKYIVMADDIHTELVAEIARLKTEGKIQEATALESDMLFAINQRQQDLRTQLAVSVQGYMAMELVRKNNDELIKGVERARTTTLHALRTAVIVAQALDNQKLVLDQIDSVNAVTNNTIARTGEMLKQQTQRIHQQAASSGVDVKTLEKAFTDIYETMNAIDTFKIQANASMEQTREALDAQLKRTKPYLDRTRALEAPSAASNTLRIEQ